MEYSSSTTVQKLQAPLLGVEPNELDQEEYHIVTANAIAILADDVHDDDEEEEDTSADDSFCFNFFIIWFFLSLLLFVQFGVALKNAQQDDNDEAMRYLSWSIVNISIIIFCLTTWLYRNTCIETKLSNTFIVMLLPEIILNTIVILVLMNKTPVAFYTLLLGSELLSVISIVASVRYLYCSRHSQEQVEDEDDEQEASVSKNDDYTLMVV
jgi:cytochrome c biogenesis factor